MPSSPKLLYPYSRDGFTGGELRKRVLWGLPHVGRWPFYPLMLSLTSLPAEVGSALLALGAAGALLGSLELLVAWAKIYTPISNLEGPWMPSLLPMEGSMYERERRGKREVGWLPPGYEGMVDIVVRSEKGSLRVPLSVGLLEGQRAVVVLTAQMEGGRDGQAFKAVRALLKAWQEDGWSIYGIRPEHNLWVEKAGELYGKSLYHSVFENHFSGPSRKIGLFEKLYIALPQESHGAWRWFHERVVEVEVVPLKGPCGTTIQGKD